MHISHVYNALDFFEFGSVVFLSAHQLVGFLLQVVIIRDTFLN